MQKLHSIQYLRAIAVMVVVVFHANIRLPQIINADVSNFLEIGAAGVDLFFVISGFIMWVITHNRPKSPKEFMLKRIARIVPLYWCVTLITALLALTVMTWITVTPEHVIKSLLFIPHESPSQPGNNWPILIPGWTLNYEMFFYAIFAACLFLPGKQCFYAILTLLVGLVGLGFITDFKNPIFQEYTNPLLLEFAMGVLIGAMWLNKLTPKGLFAGLLCLAGVIALLASAFIDTNIKELRVLYWGIPSALIVMSSLNFVLPKHLDKTLLLIGDASYSIYLSHTIGLTFLAKAWTAVPFAFFKTEMSSWLYLLLGLIGSCVGGIILYYILEKPSEKWARKILIKDKS